MSTGWIIFLCVCVVVFLLCIIKLVYTMVKYGAAVDAPTKNLEKEMC